MLLINCPHCGSRAQTEFVHGGDASVRRPGAADRISLDDWLDYVYLRENPRGPYLEWWYHRAGCRRWIRVCRDTLTHEMLGCDPAGDASGGSGDV